MTHEFTEPVELKDFSTKALFEELITREGVEGHWVEPGQDYEIVIKGRDLVQLDDSGPAWILEVID